MEDMGAMDHPRQTGSVEGMEMSGPLGLTMSREGSGTAWQPDSTPVHGHHFMSGDWALMFHYSLFAGFDAQTTPRGARELMSTNWLMFMAQRPLGSGTFDARVMLSGEPFTMAGARGYPLLLQSGETADGEALHDRQHPHDLFMEAAVQYRRELTSDLGLELYLAASGEPALGPVAFPHRLSASADPLAALGHHWEDSTHISFGVLTAGVFTRQLKLEASWFNGREPDENRYNFDFRVPDSFAARLSYNPTADLSIQVSYGYLRSPEVLEPDQSLQRVTTSATYNRQVSADTNWATTLVLGRNMPAVDTATTAALLESNFDFGRNSVFGRAELLQKTGHDLVLGAANEDTAFPVGALALGYVRDFGPFAGVTPGIGVRGALNFIPSELQAFYGTALPVGGMVFIRLRPAAMAHGGGHVHHEMAP
jgi:hypothetical protein